MEVKIKKKKNYINNKDFHEEIMKFYQLCEEHKTAGKKVPEIPVYLSKCIFHIGENLLTKYRFSQYSYKDDMLGDAIEKMIEAIRYKKFDPIISQNPFAYFTQISWNSFLQRIEKENKESYTKHKNMENMVLFSDEFRFEYNDDDNMSIKKVLNNQDHINVIENFEKPKSTDVIKHRNLSYERNSKRKKKEVLDL